MTEVIEQKEDDSLVPLYHSDRVGEELLVTLPGYRWTVTYFHRIVDEMALVTTYDPQLNPTLQDYTRVNDLTIYVEEALGSGSSDNLAGSGIIDLNIIPNPNDLFVTKLPDGRSVIYAITSVTRINYNNEGLFRIAYELFQEVSDVNEPVFTKLMVSTTTILNYNPDYRVTHTKSLYTDDELVLRDKLTASITRLAEYWTNTFITPKTYYKMGYRGADGYLVFDPKLEDFIVSVLGISVLPSRTELLRVKDDRISILDFIINDNISFNRVEQLVTSIPSAELGSNPYLAPVFYSNVDKITRVSTIPDDSVAAPVIDPAGDFTPINDEYYLFSTYVYRIIGGEDGTPWETLLSKFDVVFLDTMLGRIPDIDVIDELYVKLYELDTVEQFYFMPIMMYIMRYYAITFTVKFI